jgi:hypothetical protein
MTYRALGKEVLHDREHIADAASNDLAERIAAALNCYTGCAVDSVTDAIMPELDIVEQSLPPCPPGIDPNYHAMTEAPLHAVRREGDQYACKCGIRWDADEGSDHP